MSSFGFIGLTLIAIALIVVVLLQQKNSSLGSMAGQDSGDEIAQTRRGADKFLHQLTVVLALVFGGGCIWMMFS